LLSSTRIKCNYFSYSKTGAYPELAELLLSLKSFLSRLLDFEIIGIKLKGRLLEEGIQIIGIELYYKFHKEITNDEVQFRSH
jgi:hypothetical protein